METFSALLAICAGNSPVPGESPHKGQWRGALMFSLICTWINNREAGDLRRYRAHYDVIVMPSWWLLMPRCLLDVGTSTAGMPIKSVPYQPRASWRHQRKTFSTLLSLKFVRGIHRSPVDVLPKRPVTWTFNVSLLSVGANCVTNTRLTGKSRRHDGHLTSL